MPPSTRTRSRRPALALLASIGLVTAGLVAPISSAQAAPNELGAPADSAAVPTYDSPELQARSNLPVNDDGWNLPPGAQFNSITPVLNDDATVSFRVQLVPVPGQSGVYAPGIWSGGHGEGGLVYTGEANQRASDDVSINGSGDIAFTIADGGVDNKLWRYDAQTGTSEQVGTSPVFPRGYRGPSIDDAGDIGFTGDFGTGKAYAGAVDGSGQIFVNDRNLDPDSPWTYLYTPDFNDTGQIAAKVATSDDLVTDIEIRLFERDGTSRRILANHAVDPNSPYEKFNNSVSVNDEGVVAVVAHRTDGTEVVIRSDGETTTEIARAGDSDVIKDIDYFTPDVNDDGLVVFRGSDAQGQAVYVGDGTSLTRVAGKGDVVETDQGPGQLGQHDSSPVFGGSPTINNHGDVAFAAGLHPQGDNQVEWGSGVFVAYAEGDTQPPVEGSVTGVVTDRNDGQPVAGATVTLTDESGETAASTSTGSDGSYGVDVEPGTYTVTTTAEHYTTAGSTVVVEDTDEPQTVDVVLDTAVITVDPGSFDFDSSDGDTQTAELTVTNDGSAPLTWEAATEDDWLGVEPADGTVAVGDSTTVTLTVDATDLTDGTHAQSLVVSGNAARQPSVAVPVTLVVGSDEPGDPSTARVNLGGGDYTDGDGDLWAAEQPSVDGGPGYLGEHTKAHRIGQDVRGTDDDLLFQQSRSGVTGYVFDDLPAGSYRVDLGYVAFDRGVGGPVARHYTYGMDHNGGRLVVDLPFPTLTGGTRPGISVPVEAMGASISSIEVTPAP